MRKPVKKEDGGSKMNRWCCLLMWAVYVCFTAVSAAEADETDIIVPKDGDHRVCFRSGDTVYVEKLTNGRWVGCSWSANGQTESADNRDSEAFLLAIKTMPNVDAPATTVSDGWEWINGSELPKESMSEREYVVELKNTAIPITVKIHTLLDGTPVLTRWLELSNRSEGPIALMDCYPWAGKLWAEDAPIHLGHSLGREVGSEARFGWTALTAGDNLFRNDTDRLWDDPYFVLRNESNEEYFFGQLAWAGNYQMEFRRQEGLTFKAGPVASKALRIIDKNETVVTPAMHLGYMQSGFDAAVQAMHDHIRRSVKPTVKPELAYRSQYLAPGDWNICHYHGEMFNEENMTQCIDVAAAAGLEVFILDGPTWVEGYGNWLTPHLRRFPRGLSPMIQYAHEKGLLFGLYFETEGGRDGDTAKTWDAGAAIGMWKDSQVFRQHPEWFIRANVDLTIPAAAEYLKAELGRIIEHYGLDLYRHDANGSVFYPPGPGAGQTLRTGRFIESDYWRYYEAVNGIFRRLHAKYPDVILQQASAGGYRMDMGTVGVFSEHFAGDFGGQIFSYRRLSGATVFLPPEIIVMAMGLCHPSALPDRDTVLRCGYAMGCTPMFFTTLLPGSVEAFKPQDQQRYQRYAQLYKTFIRPLLATSKVYHHAPVNATGGVETGDWLVMEFTSPDKKQGWATIIYLADKTAQSYLFKPKGLDVAKKYAVTSDNTGKTEVMDGATLMQTGLTIQPAESTCSELLLFQQQ